MSWRVRVLYPNGAVSNGFPYASQGEALAAVLFLFRALREAHRAVPRARIWKTR